MKGVDLDAPGNINGVPVLEVDMESFEEKPWRKPGVYVSVYKTKTCYYSFSHYSCRFLWGVFVMISRWQMETLNWALSRIQKPIMQNIL